MGVVMGGMDALVSDPSLKLKILVGMVVGGVISWAWPDLTPSQSLEFFWTLEAGQGATQAGSDWLGDRRTVFVAIPTSNSELSGWSGRALVEVVGVVDFSLQSTWVGTS